MSNPDPSDRKADADAADDRAEFTETKFGRRRVGGAAWSWRRVGWALMWPLKFFKRRKAARGSFPKSTR